MGTTAIHCCAVHVPDRAKHMLSSNMSFTMAVGCGGLWCPCVRGPCAGGPASNQQLASFNKGHSSMCQ